MQTERKIEESVLSPSFNCYSSDSSTISKAVDKVIHEHHASASPFHEFGGVEGDDFAFSLVFSGEEEADIQSWTTTTFPVFNRDVLANDEISRKEYGSALITSSFGNLFIDDDQEESSSYSSSSEVDELENIPSGTFCVWKPKTTDGASSPVITKCKKSSSTGSTGSKRWKIRYSFKRSNSEGKEPMVSLLTPNINNNKKKTKIDTSPKQKRSPGGLKARPVHELFYVQRRAENEMDKKKSYLPYRKDIFGLFSNVNGMGKMLPF